MKNKIIFFVVALWALVFCFSGFFFAVNSASTSVEPQAIIKALFQSGSNNYAIHRAEIVKGAVFSFFGYKWKVVSVKGNVATFWMTEPYKETVFSDADDFADKETEEITGIDKDNIWNNGYTGATWRRQTLPMSTARETLLADIESTFKTKDGWGRVVSGKINGVNEETTSRTVGKVFYRKDSSTHYLQVRNEEITANYGIGLDKLWLPSYEEVKDGGLWGINNEYRNWTDADDFELAWLRTPNHRSTKGVLVGYDETVGDIKSKDKSSIFEDFINQEHGLRPAVHLDMTPYSVQIVTPTASANVIAGSTTNLLATPATANVVDAIGQMKYAVVTEGSVPPAEAVYFAIIPTAEGLTAGRYTVYSKFFVYESTNGFYVNSNALSVNVVLIKETAGAVIFDEEFWRYALIATCVLGVTLVFAAIIIASKKRRRMI